MVDAHTPATDQVVGVTQPLRQPLDPLGGGPVQSVPGVMSVAVDVRSEEELAEELVLP